MAGARMSENIKNLPILFVDMDCVLSDFCNSPMFEKHEQIQNNPPRMYEEFFFETLPVVDGALWAIRKLMPYYDIHVLTQPVMNTHYSYSEKAAWIWKWFPELGGKLHLTQNKEFFSGPGRVLIDDSVEKWYKKWEDKGGMFIHFSYSPMHNNKINRSEWERIVQELLS